MLIGHQASADLSCQIENIHHLLPSQTHPVRFTVALLSTDHLPTAFPCRQHGSDTCVGRPLTHRMKLDVRLHVDLM